MWWNQAAEFNGPPKVSAAHGLDYTHVCLHIPAIFKAHIQ